MICFLCSRWFLHSFGWGAFSTIKIFPTATLDKKVFLTLNTWHIIYAKLYCFTLFLYSYLHYILNLCFFGLLLNLATIFTHYSLAIFKNPTSLFEQVMTFSNLYCSTKLSFQQRINCYLIKMYAVFTSLIVSQAYTVTIKHQMIKYGKQLPRPCCEKDWVIIFIRSLIKTHLLLVETLSLNMLQIVIWTDQEVWGINTVVSSGPSSKF